MDSINTTVGALLVGDELDLPGMGDSHVNWDAQPLVVKGVASLGAVVIVDFTDGTSTAPVPGHAPVRIRRAA